MYPVEEDKLTDPTLSKCGRNFKGSSVLDLWLKCDCVPRPEGVNIIIRDRTPVTETTSTILTSL
jgi:hypothetical protein